jgi:hypothetical protein
MLIPDYRQMTGRHRGQLGFQFAPIKNNALLFAPRIVFKFRRTHNPTRRREAKATIKSGKAVYIKVCPNSARQLITIAYGKEQNATRRFHKCLQLLRNVQLEKSMGWTQNPPTFGSWGFNSPSRHHRSSFPQKVQCTAYGACVRKVCAEPLDRMKQVAKGTVSLVAISQIAQMGAGLGPGPSRLPPRAPRSARPRPRAGKGCR